MNLQLIANQGSINGYIRHEEGLNKPYIFNGFTNTDNPFDMLRLDNIKLLVDQYRVTCSADIEHIRDYWMSRYATDTTLEYLIDTLFEMVLKDLPYYNDWIIQLVKDNAIDEYKQSLGISLDTKHEVLFIY
ncbi:hypothetical protein V4F87_003274 [Vibrio parahaemolyticus]|nr:hypothetical protein [Vibrio parahaemolyticus]